MIMPLNGRQCDEFTFFVSKMAITFRLKSSIPGIQCKSEWLRCNGAFSWRWCCVHLEAVFAKILPRVLILPVFLLS